MYAICLEGSVRRGGAKKLRITAQLIQVGEQTHLWAESYQRPLTDIFKHTGESAPKITHSLSIQLLPAAANTSATSHVNVESYDRYLLGLHELGEGTRETVNKAIQYFQEGIAKDPKDARLYSALGEAYEALNTYYSSPTEVMPRVKAAALQALQIDPNLASAHVLLGDVHLLFDWDWPAAEAEYRRALEINPSLPEAQLGYATYLATLGRFEEALSRVQQAYIFDPLAIDSRNDALWIYYFSGRMSETVQQSQKAIELKLPAGLPYTMLHAHGLHPRNGTTCANTTGHRKRYSFCEKLPSVITTTTLQQCHTSGRSGDAKRLLSKALDVAEEPLCLPLHRFFFLCSLADLDQTLESLQHRYLQAIGLNTMDQGGVPRVKIPLRRRCRISGSGSPHRNTR